jgi:hypothetical protein
MKKLLLAVLAVALMATLAFAGQVRGYTRSNGTYVNSYQRSSPNSTVQDNYSYKGNSNPYTGAVGTNRYTSSPSSQYYNPAALKTPSFSPGNARFVTGSDD